MLLEMSRQDLFQLFATLEQARQTIKNHWRRSQRNASKLGIHGWITRRNKANQELATVEAIMRQVKFLLAGRWNCDSASPASAMLEALQICLDTSTYLRSAFGPLSPDEESIQNLIELLHCLRQMVLNTLPDAQKDAPAIAAHKQMWCSHCGHLTLSAR